MTDHKTIVICHSCPPPATNWVGYVDPGDGDLWICYLCGRRRRGVGLAVEIVDRDQYRNNETD